VKCGEEKRIVVKRGEERRREEKSYGNRSGDCGRKHPK